MAGLMQLSRVGVYQGPNVEMVNTFLERLAYMTPGDWEQVYVEDERGEASKRRLAGLKLVRMALLGKDVLRFHAGTAELNAERILISQLPHIYDHLGIMCASRREVRRKLTFRTQQAARSLPLVRENDTLARVARALCEPFDSFLPDDFWQL